MQVLANDAKESLEKYKQELLAAKIEKEKLQQNLQNVAKEIATVSEELKSMGVEEQNTLESLCKQFICLFRFSFFHFCFLIIVFRFHWNRTEIVQRFPRIWRSFVLGYTWDLRFLCCGS